MYLRWCDHVSGTGQIKSHLPDVADILDEVEYADPVWVSGLRGSVSAASILDHGVQVGAISGDLAEMAKELVNKLFNPERIVIPISETQLDALQQAVPA